MLDNNLSPRVARALAALFDDDEVRHKRDKFAPDTPDTEWIAALGRERAWCVISADRRITKNRAEQAAWRSTDLIGFFMEPSLANASPPAQTARLIRYWPLLQTQSFAISGPAMFGLTLGGSQRLKQIAFRR